MTETRCRSARSCAQQRPHTALAPPRFTASVPEVGSDGLKQDQEWRDYWLLVLPAILSWYIGWSLGVLLFAHLVLGGGYGAIGGLLAWAGITSWRARPGGDDQTNAAMAARRHVPGTWQVQRPASRGDSATVQVRPQTLEDREVEAPRRGQDDSGPSDDAGIAPKDLRWAKVIYLSVIVVDVAVATTVVVTAAWPLWTAVLAAGLLVHHLWLLGRVVRRGRNVPDGSAEHV